MNCVGPSSVSVRLARDVLPSKEGQLIVFQISVVKAAQDITHTQTLGDTFSLLELFFVECDVVVLADVLKRLK